MVFGSARKASGARPDAYTHSKCQVYSCGNGCSKLAWCSGRGGEEEAALSLTLTVSTCTRTGRRSGRGSAAPGGRTTLPLPGPPKGGAAVAQWTARATMTQRSPPGQYCIPRVMREPGRRGTVPPRLTTSSSTITVVVPKVRRTRPACAGSGPPQQNSQASREMQLRSPASKRIASNHCGWYARPSLAQRRPSPSTLGCSGSIRNSGRIVESTARCT
mmetsp:Transcript_96372/g.281594  ORF Transcript_96372/g.281594 Transcript_96372/m.281594 type:complete len:217 (+) Transcript_96372:519-1169(+)